MHTRPFEGPRNPFQRNDDDDGGIAEYTEAYLLARIIIYYFRVSYIGEIPPEASDFLAEQFLSAMSTNFRHGSVDPTIAELGGVVGPTLARSIVYPIVGSAQQLQYLLQIAC